MHKLDLIPIFNNNIEKCNTCMLTKITRNPFPKVKRKTKLLDLIHSDLCDMHNTPTLGGKKYFVTFIDDCSRYCYVYLLHSKDEALDKFKVYKSEVELQCESFIKCLRSDRGGEYYNPSYFESTGIVHQVSAPYTPQQNGVAEMKNRVLTEMVNSILSYSGLRQGFWGEAVLTACHILNRVPNKETKITPYDQWKKRKPNLNYLKVWGCRAIVKVLTPKRKKLGERGIECIFIGYAHNSKAYRFMVIEPNDSISINTVIQSRDAIFDENRFNSISRQLQPQQLIHSSNENEIPLEQIDNNDKSCQELRRSKRIKRSKILDQISLCFL